MKAVRYSLLVIAVVAIASVVIGAEEKKKADASSVAATEQHKVLNPADLQWGDPPPGFPAGAKVAVLSGDPKKSGVYTVRLHAPAGYKIMPHSHPAAEMVTVISGTLYLATGDKFDESAGHAMTAGAFTAMPAGMKHFARFTEDTIIQVHGEGPFQIVYVNPADDPRNAKK